MYYGMHPRVQEAIQLLETANEEGEEFGLMFTGGKDSMVILNLWRDHIGGQPPLLVVDTYNQFDEVYDFRSEIAERWGLELDVRANEAFLEEVIWSEDDDRGFAWDGPKTDGCCGALKIDVISDFISDGYETLIVGRRAADVDGDLEPTETKREPLPHERIHPLCNWSDNLVEAYITREGVPLPELYSEGYEHTDCVDCTVQGEEGDDWSGVSQEKKEQLKQLRDMGYM